MTHIGKSHLRDKGRSTHMKSTLANNKITHICIYMYVYTYVHTYIYTHTIYVYVDKNIWYLRL